MFVACGRVVVSHIAYLSDRWLTLLILLRSVGGVGSLSVSMSWWTLAMLAYPETQARAHAELDAVVGRTRLPEIFGKNADDFDPSRYLDASGEMAPGLFELKKDGHFSYGFGSRICVGRHMADNSLFINIATMLWAMKIERKKDASGHFLPLDVDGWVDVGLVVLGVFITYR